MQGVLAGVRVIDMTTGPAGAMATTVLADFGADVVIVEPPGGGAVRAAAAGPFWLRGKRSVVVDHTDATGVGMLDGLIAATDVLVVSGPPDRLDALELDGATRCGADPRLVHCTITGWGPRGPLAGLPGNEGLVAAASGRMQAFDVQLGRGRPVFAAVPVATHIAAQAAVQGVLAALWRRHRSGRGGRVETSLLQSLAVFDLVDLLHRQVRDAADFVPLRRMSPMPTLNYHPVRAADGTWIQCGNLLEHLFLSFLDAIDLLGELLIDERFQESPALWQPDDIEEVRDRILTRVQERPATEWMQRFDDNGNVAAEPIVSTADAIGHRDLVEGRGLVTIEDPHVGPTVQIGPIAELAASPATPTVAAPRLGGDNVADVVAAWSRSGRPAAGHDAVREEPSPAGRPLDGVTIIDLSTIIAAPLGMSMLADLGARVVKVEPVGGDPFRFLLPDGVMAVKTNLGKESICVDLKTDDGRAVLHRLAADADVVVHNFRGSVPAKLGLDHETLQSVNPRIITAIVNGYGRHGPGAPRPATHPVMGACTGGVALQAGAVLHRDCADLTELREASRQIMAANEANPDPNTSAVAASAVLLALVDRDRTGQGQQVWVNMQVANAWANGDDFLTYDGKAPRRAVDEEHLGISATHRLYPTADGWVFVAASSDEDFAAFCAAVGATLGSDDRFADVRARTEHDAALVDALTVLFAERSADEWQATCVAAGVGCVRADGIDGDRFLFSSPQIAANGWSPEVDHARFGRFRRWSPIVTVDGPNDELGPAPLAGEHTDALLREVGYDDAAIGDLRDRHIVASEAP